MINADRQPQVLTEADREDLVEEVQLVTRRMSDAQRLWVAAAWEFMAADLRRVVALDGGAE